MNKRYFFLIFVLVMSFSISVFADEAQDLYTSEELLITQTITGSFTIRDEYVSDVQKVNANLVLFPKSTERQTVISESINPQPSYRDDNSILFQFTQPSTYETFELVSTVRTRNNYIPVQSKVSFPYDKRALPSEVLIYLEETDYIDITPSIKRQAESLATSDDVFDVAFTIASWVRENIEYNLTSITADASQSASWVFEQRNGVCDELTTLYLAMMRSVGIPTRFVSGISYTNSDLFLEKWNNHAWSEVYIDGYGWIPFDLTYGQFGYIDATHISFQKSVDSDPSKTVYTWESKGSSAVDVDFSQLDFDTVVNQKRSVIPEFIDFEVTPVYDEIGFGSWNALLVTAHNNYNHYVTANLIVSGSSEVENLQNSYSFYLKPSETKIIAVPFYIGELDDMYEYTFPFTIHNYYSLVGETQIKSAERFVSYSQESIQKHEDLLQKELNSQPLNNISANCLPLSPLLINEDIEFECTILGDKKQEGEFCFEQNCTDFEVDVNSSETFTFTTNISSYGEYVFELELNAEGSESTILLPMQISDKSQVGITLDSGNASGEYGDTYNVWFLLEKESYAPAKNVVIQVGDNFPYVWEMGTLYLDQNISVVVKSTHLQPGVNDYPIIVWFDDEQGNQHQINSSVELRLENVTFWQRIKLFFAQLLL